MDLSERIKYVDIEPPLKFVHPVQIDKNQVISSSEKTWGRHKSGSRETPD